MVVVAARAVCPLMVEVETAHRVPALQTGGTVPRVEVEVPGVGVALVLQMIIKYGAPFESVARPTHEIFELELVGVEVDD